MAPAAGAVPAVRARHLPTAVVVVAVAAEAKADTAGPQGEVAAPLLPSWSSGGPAMCASRYATSQPAQEGKVGRAAMVALEVQEEQEELGITYCPCPAAMEDPVETAAPA